jgi:hypothetical protein
MTKLFNLILFIPIISAQLISISVCEDKFCKKQCTKWTTNVGVCYPCDSIYCITTLSGITFYYDSSCLSTVILDNMPVQNIPLTVDNTCNQLTFNGANIGSAQALNLSILIGLTVSFSLLAIGGTIASICYCKKNNKCCYKKYGIKSPPQPDIPDKTFEKNPDLPPTYANTVMTYNNPVINY